MRFHIPGIPHTIANEKYLACAFTQKVIKFCRMFEKSGHTIYFYGCEQSNVPCTEFIQIINATFLEKYYGKHDPDQLTKFGNVEADNIFNKLCIAEIKKRKQPNDFILCFWGIGQKKITDHFPDCIAIEPGIGYPYSATFAPYKIFESYAYMHYVYGISSDRTNVFMGPWYHAVIPNYFDLNEFEFKENKEDYMLYLGRIMKNKGLDICIQIAEKLGVKLIIAGQGNIKDLGYKKLPNNIVCVGSADIEKRKKLMSGAKCLLLPTYYLEPFGGVVVEALLSGTPVITTDWGAFPEINLHGITGYRCRTFEQFLWAVENIHLIDPKACRKWASENFSLERIKKMYEEYFDMVYKLYTSKGFYEDNPSRTNLDWLTKIYPNPIDRHSNDNNTNINNYIDNNN